MSNHSKLFLLNKNSNKYHKYNTLCNCCQYNNSVCNCLCQCNYNLQNDETSFQNKNNDKNNNKSKSCSTEETINSHTKTKNNKERKILLYKSKSTDNINSVENIFYKKQTILNELQNEIDKEQNYINNIMPEELNSFSDTIKKEKNKKVINSSDIKIKDLNNFSLIKKKKLNNQQKSQIEFNKLLEEIKGNNININNKMKNILKNYNQNNKNVINDNKENIAQSNIYNYFNNNNDYNTFDKRKKELNSFNYNEKIQNEINYYKNNNTKDITNTNLLYITSPENLKNNINYNKNKKINNKIQNNNSNKKKSKIKCVFRENNYISNYDYNKEYNSERYINNNLLIDNYLSKSQYQGVNNYIENNNYYSFNNNINRKLIKNNFNDNIKNNLNIDYNNDIQIKKNYNRNNNIKPTNNKNFLKNVFNINFLKESSFELLIKGIDVTKNDLQKYEKENERLNKKLNEADDKIKELMKLIIKQQNEIYTLKEEINNVKKENGKEIDIEEKSNINNKLKKKNQNNKNIIGRNKDSFIIKLPDSLMSSKSRNTSNNIFRMNNKNNNINCEIYIKKIFKKSKRSNSQPNVKNLGLGINEKYYINNNIDTYNLNSQKLSKRNNNKSIYTIYPFLENRKILLFDIESKQFSMLDFIDTEDFNKNYLESYSNDESKYNTLFYTYNNKLYIVTGKNSDLFYIYNPQKKIINKICKLKNNHANGVLIHYQDKLFCLGGKFNKKVEIYSKIDNEWTEIKEMNIERSFFSSCIIKNKYLFSLFGYNNLTNKYLDSIEYYELNNINNGWKFLKYKNPNLLNMNICGFICMNCRDEKIIIFGGINGIEEKPIKIFYHLLLNKDFRNNSIIEESDKKSKDIYKNKCYYFDNGFGEFEDNKNNAFYSAFDNNYNFHIIQINNLSHDIYYFHK